MLRIKETAEALALQGSCSAQHALRAKYGWSKGTWGRYQTDAYAYLVDALPCPDEARAALVERIQRYLADPDCTSAARARFTDQLAKLLGANKPVLSTITVDAVVDHRVQAALICLTDAEARARALSLNTAALPLAAPRSLPDALGARLEPDLPSSPE
jgi:hypothetical protein